MTYNAVSQNTVTVSDLSHQASRSLLIGSLAYRVVATVAPVAILVARYGPRHSVAVTLIACVLVAANLAVLHAVRQRPALDLASIRGLLIVDVWIAFGLNLFASAVTPGTVTEPYHDVFWFYLISCVVLLTGGWGAIAGLVAIAASLPLQFVMDDLSTGGSGDVAVTLGRLLWLSTGLVMAMVILGLVGLSAREAMLHGIQAGQATERARIMRSMHDTVLQTLEAMSLDSGIDRTAPMLALAELRRAARAEARSLRSALDQLADTPRGRLRDALTTVVTAATEQGLHVELVVAETADGDLSWARVEALRDAVREALRNIVKHSGTTRALVRVEAVTDGVQVVVRDHGVGFAASATVFGFGIRESIIGRLRSVGGSAAVESTPGNGTRIRLWTPA